MREWEAATWAGGQTEAGVIQLVGRALAERVRELTAADDPSRTAQMGTRWNASLPGGQGGPSRTGHPILIVAGKGHNGDDARAAAAHLTDRHVTIVNVENAGALGQGALPSDELPRALGQGALPFDELRRALADRPQLVIDGLFGIGLNRPLDDAWVRFINLINESGVPVVAVDVPSGLDADTGQTFGACIRAALTLTVGAPKAGLIQESAWPWVGRLEVLSDVGLAAPPMAEVGWVVPEDFRNFPPRRPVASHKGSYGHLLIIAGSAGFHGAALLASRGAQRAHPGLITVQTFETVYPYVAAQLQSAMIASWVPDTKLSGPWTAVLFGPGLAAPDLPDQVKLQARLLWRDSALPMVVDASGLDWMPMDSAIRGSSVRVLTPHPGEAARMLRTSKEKIQANRVAAVRDISKRFGNAWVVLKGHQTVIGRSTGPVSINSSGNPHLAQGGSGDLLAGYIAGLLAQPGLQGDVDTLLRYAVWQHGAAADRLQSRRPNWTIEELGQELGAIPPTARVGLLC